MERLSGLYVAGLGDEHARGQDRAVADFARHGLDLSYEPVHWGDKELWIPKEKRLVSRIDDLYEESGKSLVLIGSSAGASAIFNAGEQRADKVACFVSICGKILRPGSLEGNDFEQNPAFRESLKKLPLSIAKLEATHHDRVLSLRPYWDGRVPVADTKIGYGQEIRIPMVGHVASIAFALVFMKPQITRFAYES